MEHIVRVRRGGTIRNIAYSDTATKEEARRQASNTYGSHAVVEVLTHDEYAKVVDNMYRHVPGSITERVAEEALAQHELHAEHIRAIENN